MSSTESSFTTQPALLTPYHQQAYLFNSRPEIDLLGLSQPELVNQAKAYSSIQNPHPYLAMTALAQKASPEKQMQSNASRAISTGQMAGLLGISHPSANDPFSNLLQASPLVNPMVKKVEDQNFQLSKMSLERGLPINTSSQLNSIAQLLEANELKAQAQKNFTDLLLLQYQNKAQLQNTSNLGYSFLLNSQNSLNYGAMAPSPSYFNGQNPSKKSPQAFYTQNTEFSEVEILNKRQMENQKALYKQINGIIGLEGIVGNQEFENAPKGVKLPVKNLEELKLISSEQLSFISQKQAQNQAPKQDQQQNFLLNQIKMGQPQIQTPSNKTKQMPVEITIQDEPDTPPQKETKEVQQPVKNEKPSQPEIVVTANNGPSSSELQSEPLKKKDRKCFNRLCLTDSLNDSLWAIQKINGSTVCKVCYDAYNKGQYCYHCQQIYLDDETSASNDDKEWIECEACQIWNHIECEIEHGFKNLRTLLDKNVAYKYYCPKCRPNKPSKSPLRNTKGALKHYSQSKPNSPQPLLEAEPQKLASTPHPKPDLDDNFMAEDGLKEPATRKVRVQEVIKNQNPEVVIKQVETSTENKQEDLTKKKLDYVFNKYQTNKKKFLIKVVNPAVENFSTIEKLLIQYGGKKLQLSESEIKGDLDLFKELSNQTSQPKRNPKKEEETNTKYSSTLNLQVKDQSNMGFVKNTMNSRSNRIKNKSKKYATLNGKRSADDDDTQDAENDNEFEMRSQGESAPSTGPARVLRNRKRLE